MNVGPVVKNDATSIWLKTSWNLSGMANFHFSTDGIKFFPLGHPYQITNFGNYLGAKIGLFSLNDINDKGFVDFDWFHYQFTNK
ncbi:hypothetical protein [Pedobacter rhodius]|uniref:Beta-xylosidase C-terminal Concanavalin A-like domain-containing protein n=1 Tax=Pedobacter rhodius TaxID=3004098 RepID=A0ABT4KTL9_9SPHI|nr:hypothetical protein [Pedobacter sp. SJ11]MCZ4222179.1 hypothetical protein [Pedobacter sp. SJ11]